MRKLFIFLNTSLRKTRRYTPFSYRNMIVIHTLPNSSTCSVIASPVMPLSIIHNMLLLEAAADASVFFNHLHSFLNIPVSSYSIDV